MIAVTGLTAGLILAGPVGAADDCTEHPSAPECVETAPFARTPAVAPILRSIWLYEPDPTSLPNVRSRLDEVLDNVAEANREVITNSEIRIHIIPQDANLTDLPLWANLLGLRVGDPNPYDGYVEMRTYDGLRGLGPAFCVNGPLDVAVAEEHVVLLPGGSYPSPRPADVGKTLVHEVGHAVECSLTPDQSARLDRIYATARGKPIRDVVGDTPTYSLSNRREYFAEGAVAWFELGQGASYQRAWLEQHDRALYDLLAEVFAVPPVVPECDGRRATLVVDASPVTGTPGPDVIVGSDGPDVIYGGGGNDVICGGAGDDVITGSYGADRIFGGAGNDESRGGSGNDLLSETAGGDEDSGDDQMNGGPGDDRLEGGVGADRLVDTAGADHLVGGGDDDELDTRDSAGSQADVLDGTDGFDQCTHDPGDEVSGCTGPRPTPPEEPVEDPAPEPQEPADARPGDPVEADGPQPQPQPRPDPRPEEPVTRPQPRPDPQPQEPVDPEPITEPQPPIDVQADRPSPAGTLADRRPLSSTIA